jgi:FtsZ-binding cell division protein ZapB
MAPTYEELMEEVKLLTSALNIANEDKSDLRRKVKMLEDENGQLDDEKRAWEEEVKRLEGVVREKDDENELLILVASDGDASEAGSTQGSGPVGEVTEQMDGLELEHEQMDMKGCGAMEMIEAETEEMFGFGDVEMEEEAPQVQICPDYHRTGRCRKGLPGGKCPKGMHPLGHRPEQNNAKVTGQGVVERV